jgi:hypothetical protein
VRLLFDLLSSCPGLLKHAAATTPTTAIDPASLTVAGARLLGPAALALVMNQRGAHSAQGRREQSGTVARRAPTTRKKRYLCQTSRRCWRLIRRISAILIARSWLPASMPASPAQKPVPPARTPALARTMVAELTKCIRTNLDCADICATTGAVLSRHTCYDANITRTILEACRVACGSCATECERHAGMHEHRLCGEACRRCEAACTDLLAALG